MEWTEFDTRVAAYAVIVDEQQRILLALWNESDRTMWSMPGGGVELDESPEQGVVREVREETGYDVALDGLLGVDCSVVPAAARISAGGRPLKGVRLVYAARVTGGILTNEVGGSTDEARWIPLAEVKHLDRVDLVDRSVALWRAAESAPGRAPLLVVLAGRPGTGKTTLARGLAAALRAANLRVDAVETVLHREGMDEPGVLGYAVAHAIAVATLAAGTPVVVDAVNPVPESRAGWRDLARRTGGELHVLETVLPDPDVQRARVISRKPDLAGQRVPTWDDVVGGTYLDWDESRDGARTVIDMTDGRTGLDAALAALGRSSLVR